MSETVREAGIITLGLKDGTTVSDLICIECAKVLGLEREWFQTPAPGKCSGCDAKLH